MKKTLIFITIIIFSFFQYCKDNSNPVIPSMAVVTDIDGNVYMAVRIGDQLWTTTNLKVTHYRNGDPIPNVTDNSEWGDLTTGAYCNYENNTDTVDTYGRLYNWYAVNDYRCIAPEGWHVPTDNDWQILIDFLGGDEVAGGKLKEVGTTHWVPPNTGATNESGFTALPGGRCDNNGSEGLGFDAEFWSSTECSSILAWGRILFCDDSEVQRGQYNKMWGMSIRLIRD